MASAVRKALINTAIAAAALPLCFVFRGWFSMPPFAVFLWFVPLVLGSWYCVCAQRAEKKYGTQMCERNSVMRVCTVITAVFAGLATIVGGGGFGIVIVIIFIPIHFIEFIWFTIKRTEQQIEIQQRNEQQSAVKIIDITNGKV